MSSEVELLIELVRSRPCLYDKKDPNYKDSRGVRANNWADIAKLMVESGHLNYEGEQIYNLHFIIYIIIIVLLLTTN